jgi:hypothetical protein
MRVCSILTMAVLCTGLLHGAPTLVTTMPVECPSPSSADSIVIPLAAPTVRPTPPRLTDTGETAPPVAGTGQGMPCLIRPVTDILTTPILRLYDPATVPVYHEGAEQDSAYAPQPLPTGARAADTGGYELALSGSKSLAVTAGEGGAVGVDAALFVNVKGQVADNVWIEGTLSDQNTPVQPEGNTTTLREVDVKYVRVYGRQYDYLLGDYLLQHGREGEDRYSIQAEGARLRYGDNGRAGTFLWARSKGLYHNDTLRGVDGKQRGYYLRGRDGRTFITVLAGTERVWRNGVPLTRGVDYSIDYAQGRIDFLTPVWVTGENLFSVEFQYMENAFPRSVVGGEAADTLGAFRVSVRAIQESEDEQNPATGFPDAATLNTYRQAGDRLVSDSLGPVDMPARQAVTVFSGEWDGQQAGQARATVLGSLYDRNLYSGFDDEDNLGFSTRYSGVHRLGRPRDEGGLMRVIVEPEHEHRSRDYASFRQLVETRNFRDAWNLEARVGERDFDANRLRVTLEPYSGWTIGGGAGYAVGRVRDTVADTIAPFSGPDTVITRMTSQRGEVFAGVVMGATRFDASAEVKQARDPARRDNDRQQLAVQSNLAGWLSHATLLRDGWTNGRAVGDTLARAELWQPRLRAESPALADRWVVTPEVDALYGRSDYAGRRAGLEDSLIDLGAASRLRLLGWGPVTGEVYAARRHQRVWRPDGTGDRSLSPEAAVYDQAEANLSISDYLKGYGAQLHYRAARTAETPLVEAYSQVAAGRGDYALDSALYALDSVRVYYPVETGGDFVLVGLVRDSTLGQQPYQDLQWSLRLDLTPGKWPAPFLVAGGVLADMEFSLDLETDHQDSTVDALPLPRFTDAQINAVRSGRSRYEPSLRWFPASPTGAQQSASLHYRREYAKGAGVNAFLERLSESRLEYRREWRDVWEGAWIGALENRWRQSVASGTASSDTRAQRGQMLLYRRLPSAVTLIPSLEYRHVAGEDGGFPVDLHGLVPRARLEKGNFFGGRASAEYGWHWLRGTGDGGYFVSEGFRKGVTHRVECVAQSEVRRSLHVNANYLARLEPRSTTWSQRFSAEVRAVF